MAEDIVFRNLDGQPDHPPPVKGDDEAAPDVPGLIDPFADDEPTGPLELDDDEKPRPKKRAEPKPEPEADLEPEEPEEEPEGEGDDEPPPLAALQRENEQLRRQMAEFKRAMGKRDADLAESQMARIERDIEAKRAALREAIEAGETDDQVKLTDELTDLRVERAGMKSKVEAAKAAAEKPAEPGADAGPPLVVPQNEAARKWINGKRWVNDPRHAKANEDLIRISGQVADDGYDPERTDYYAEVERRMKRRHPALFSAPARQPSRQAVSPVTTTQARTGARSGRKILTVEDQRNLRSFNLDPTDPEVQRAFFRENPNR